MIVLQCAILFTIISSGLGRVFVVDNTSQQDKADGSVGSPFKTIQDCVNALKTIGKPGDECQIRAGQYHENVKIDNLQGTPNQPYMIRGYGDERPKIDGTIPIFPAIDPETGDRYDWKTLSEDSKIYKTKINQDIWQLFVNNQMMTNARWPNAKWSDRSIFKGSLWAKLDNASKKGYMVNKGRSLAQTNINMTNAVAVLNIGSFNTFVAKVEDHQAGQNWFNYKDTFNNDKFKPSISKYFIEDKLELLDTPEEWFYDQETKTLYVWMPNGDSPKDHELRGKVQTYAMEITNTHNLVLKNLDFFATAISAISSRSENVDGVKFDSLIFNYPTYSKRMLGDISLIKRIRALGRSRRNYGSFVFFNNTFYGSDGATLDINGFNVTYDNNLWEYNDWTGANMLTFNGGKGPINTYARNEVYYRNTFRYNDASTSIQPGLNPRIILNHVVGTCWGTIQNDGAGIHLMRGQQMNAQLRYNWVHNTPKYALRFDGQPPRIGRNGTMSHNVAFQSNGIMVKGDSHLVENNLAFQKYNENDDDKQGTGCSLCILKFVRANPGQINNNSVVINNIADRANGGINVWKRPNVFPVPGRIVKNNKFNAKIAEQIMDHNNFDFRPVKGSRAAVNGIGPYRYEERMTEYWIPGRKLYKTSTPVPQNGSVTVKAARRDAVMFLQAWDCRTHIIYFGSNKRAVENARDVDDINYLGTLENGSNVFYLPNKLSKLATYFWRVDAMTDTGIVYKGDVWNFTTKGDL